MALRGRFWPPEDEHSECGGTQRDSLMANLMLVIGPGNIVRRSAPLLF